MKWFSSMDDVIAEPMRRNLKAPGRRYFRRWDRSVGMTMSDHSTQGRKSLKIMIIFDMHPNKASNTVITPQTSMHHRPYTQPNSHNLLPEPFPRNPQCPYRLPHAKQRATKKNQQSNLTPPAHQSASPHAAPIPLRRQSADVFNPVRPPVFHHHQKTKKPPHVAGQSRPQSAARVNHDREQQRRGTTTTMEIAVSGRED